MRFCKKNSASEGNESLLSDCRAQPVLCKNSASEGNESLFSNCRAQPVLFKNSASEGNESLFSDCRAQPVLCKNSASEGNESLLSDCRAQPVLCKNSDSERDETMFSDCLIRSGMYKKRLRGRSVPPHLPFHPECAGVCVSLLRSPVSDCRAVLFTNAGILHSVLHLLADVLRYGVDVHHVVHCVGNDEVLRHIPYAFIVTGFTP